MTGYTKTKGGADMPNVHGVEIPVTIEREMGLIDRLARLYVAVVADSLDQVGVRANVMHPRIRPLYPEAVVAGFARTLEAVTASAAPIRPEDRYKPLLQAVDAQRPGDVLVFSTCEQACWGELLATASRQLGSRGVVVDGYVRDSAALISMRFPTFAAGILAYDSLGRLDIKATDVEIECGGVKVCSGDLILGDHDGVLVVPQALAEEVITWAEEKVSGENTVRVSLSEGMPIAEAFARYGVI